MTYVLDPSFDDAQRQRIMDNFSRMALVRGKDKRTLLKAVDEKRSDRQNRYYWSALQILQRHMSEHFDLNHAAEVWHEFFKVKYLTPTTTELNGEIVRLYRTTTQLTKKEFAEYMDSIIGHCAMEWGCAIPPPDRRES